MITQSIHDHTPSKILIDGVEQDSATLLEMTAKRGITITATRHHQNLREALLSPTLQTLLGVSTDEQSSTPSKRSRAVFSTAIEIHDKGQFYVYSNVNQATEQLLRGEAPTGKNISQ